MCHLSNSLYLGDASWRCRDPHCNVAFVCDAKSQLHETESQQINVTVISIDAEIETVSNIDTDDVFNNYSNFMKR